MDINIVPDYMKPESLNMKTWERERTKSENTDKTAEIERSGTM